MPRHSHAIVAGLALAALTAARAHAQGARCFMLNDPDPEDGGRFGQHVQIVDLNGDGLGELVIGAPGKTVAGNSAAGQVLIKVGPVEPGNAGWVVVTQPHSVPALFDSNPRPNNRFGSRIVSADFDSDGFVDLAVAAPGVYVGGYGRDLDWAQGAVFILYGPWDLSLSPPYAGGSIAIVEDAANRRNDPAVHAVGDQFGFRIAVGDPNADSHPDLVIGSPFSVCSADAHNYCGQAYVYWGPSFTDWYELTLPGPPHGPPRNDRLWGLDVACGNVVDVETVGTDDVLIAAYNSEEGGTGNAGRFRLFRDFPNASPGPRGFDRYEDVLRPGGNVLGADFGEVLALGNYDGDHLLDVAVSAPRDFGVADGDNISGEVFVFPGASFPTGSIRLTISRPSAARKDMFGAAMAWLDHDADGIDELLVGAPWYNLGSSPPIGRHGEGRAVLVNFPRLHAWIDDPSPQELTSADGFGSAAAAGALDDNPRIDLAIGNPAASFTSGSTTFVLAGEVRVVID